MLKNDGGITRAAYFGKIHSRIIDSGRLIERPTRGTCLSADKAREPWKSRNCQISSIQMVVRAIPAFPATDRSDMESPPAGLLSEAIIHEQHLPGAMAKVTATEPLNKRRNIVY